MQTLSHWARGRIFFSSFKNSKVKLKFLVQVKHIKEPDCQMINIPQPDSYPLSKFEYPGYFLSKINHHQHLLVFSQDWLTRLLTNNGKELKESLGLSPCLGLPHHQGLLCMIIVIYSQEDMKCTRDNQVCSEGMVAGSGNFVDKF